MGQVFKGQDLIVIADLNTDITGCTCFIKYRRPDGEVGSQSATITDAENGLIQTVLSLKDDLAQAGKWNLWGYAIFADGREVPGEAEQIHVYEEGYLPRSSSIYN